MKVFPADVAARNLESGWWDGSTWDSRARASAATRPDKVALIDPANRSAITDGAPRTLTWMEVDAAADRLAAQLLSAGIAAGDVVGVQLPNVAELAVTYLAIARIGAAVAPFPVQYREHELSTLGARADAVAFVTATRILGRANAEAIAALRPDLPTMHSVLAFGDDVPPGVVALDGDAATPSAEAVVRLARHVESHTIDPNDAITICWTSGTESTPKGVPRCHGDWSAVLWTTIESAHVTADDVLLCTFPMVNAGGLGGMFGPWISQGCTLVLHQPFDVMLFLQQIAEHGVTYTVSPPAVLTKLLLSPELLEQFELSSLRAVGSGSAPLTPFLVEGWEDRGVEVINFFGSNEGLPLVGDRDTIPAAAERAAYFPNFGVDGVRYRVRTAAHTSVKLVDVETGELITGPGRPGELRAKGPTIFAGYLGGLGAPFDDEGYYRSGDVFEYADDEQRLLRYVDRAKDLIIRGGMNISPAEIEGLVQSHPKVAEVAAVGAPDDILGERVAVFVVARDGEDLALGELIEHLKAQRVAKFKLPERLELVDDLPRNPVGKVLKRDLRARLTAGASPSSQT